MRFYATSAPSWWPYQTASLGHNRAPPRLGEPGFYRVLLDNGMFTWAKERAAPPDLDAWLARLYARARRLEARRDVAEVWVVLPDWPRAPEVTWRAARHRLARAMCRDYRCLVPVHLTPGRGLLTPPPELAEAVEAVRSLDAPAVLALPMKMYCTRPDRTGVRRIPLPDCQERFALLAARAALGEPAVAGVHALAPTLSPPHVRRLWEAGVTSMDTNSWTRPNSTTLRRMARHSAKNTREKTVFFAAALRRLLEAGVPVEGAREALAGVEAHG